jgi:hypothetical protein
VRRPASMDKIDSMDFFGLAPILKLHREETTWQRFPQRAPVRSRRFRK